MSAEATKPDSAHPLRRKGEGKTYRNFVGGQWASSESSKTVPNINPADTREVLTVQCRECAAESTLPENVTSAPCPFCGSSLVTTHLDEPSEVE